MLKIVFFFKFKKRGNNYNNDSRGGDGRPNNGSFNRGRDDRSEYASGGVFNQREDSDGGRDNNFRNDRNDFGSGRGGGGFNNNRGGGGFNNNRGGGGFNGGGRGGGDRGGFNNQTQQRSLLLMF